MSDSKEQPNQPIVNVDALAFEHYTRGERYEARIALAGLALGSRKLGFNVTEVPPGKRATPYHLHRVNEELFFVLEGRGAIRIDGATYPLRAGDLVSLPPGPRSAHQIVPSVSTASLWKSVR